MYTKQSTNKSENQQSDEISNHFRKETNLNDCNYEFLLVHEEFYFEYSSATILPDHCLEGCYSYV